MKLSNPQIPAASIQKNNQSFAPEPVSNLSSLSSLSRLHPAARDPFSLFVTPAPIPPAASAPVPPPMPNPPAQEKRFEPNLQFIGRVITPDGRQLIYADLDHQPLTLSAGKTLPNGYLVRSIRAESMDITDTASGQTATIALPAAPAYEVR